MATFKDRMLHAYDTPRDAFANLDAGPLDLDAALDEDPIDLQTFTQGTKHFRPPLSDGEAIYAFMGLDANQDGKLEVHEFLSVLESGRFSSHPMASSTLALAHEARSSRVANGQDAANAPITMDQFKMGMLKSYASAPEAFDALDASETNLMAAQDSNPVHLKQFITGVKSFQPPLTPEQAIYAFRALDADDNGILVAAEFSEGLNRREFRAPKITVTPVPPPVPAVAPAPTISPMTPARPGAVARPPSPAVPMSPAGALPIPITLEEFKQRMGMKNAQNTAVFIQAFEANPIDLEGFIRGTSKFTPPLTREQAVFAFKCLDADHDNSLPDFEFFSVLQRHEFATSVGHAAASGSSSLRPSFANQPNGGPDNVGDGVVTTSTGPNSKQAGNDGNTTMLKVLGLAVLPLACMLLLCVRVLVRGILQGRRNLAPGQLTSFTRMNRMVQDKNSPGSPTTVPRKRRKDFLSNREFLKFLGCCLRSGDEEDGYNPCVPCTPTSPQYPRGPGSPPRY
jgi:Ca2+-binding EF-hand superfamily protein